MDADKAARKKAKHEQREARRAARAERKYRRKNSILIKELWNLPNVLSMGRIAVIPLFVWLTYDADPLSSMWAALVFGLAAATDVIDGFIARRWNMITVTGKLLDPLADKLMVSAALVMMTRLGRVPAWVVIVLLSRELMVSGLRQIAASEGLVISAGQEGKWKTSLQVVGLILLCTHYTHDINFGFATYPVDCNLVGKIFVYLSTFFSVLSAGGYFRAFFKTLSGPGNTSGSAA